MATITQISNYVQLAAKTASDVTSSWQNWTAFLQTAARLYRYSFTDQLLIHAQNPQASACADYDTWYRRMRWYVKRGYLAGKADLLGAIRLPNNAFKANAGTDVVSDIIFLQKRDTPAAEEPSWVQTAQNADGFTINRYFIDHPDMVLGLPSAKSTQYGRQDYTVLPLPDGFVGNILVWISF